MKGALAVIGLLAFACAPSPPAPDKIAPPAPAASVPSAASAPAPRPSRPQLDGRAFPDKVLALTWDDGPDAGTLALAEYLHDQGVSATFFVVAEWIDGLSEEPGRGRGVFETGHEHIPILGDLVGLGHRIGNHTLNHVLLDAAPASRVVEQLRENEARIDPFVTGGLRLFRVPGGAWNAAASAAVDADPAISTLVGPVRWDVDGKDWEGSLYCRSKRPSVECERAAPGGGLRVKPKVIAQRYLSAIESAGHGIVLMHDRVGHVGSGYARAVAETLIPALVARGYVFAAPVLRFAPLAPHAAPECGPPARARPQGDLAGIDPGSAQLGDVNGDGRADICGWSREGVMCALSDGRSFLKATLWLPETSSGTMELCDVNGDGRADVCVKGPEGWACGLSP